MANYTLIAQAPLEGYRKTFANTELSEVTDLAIVSLAIPQNGDSTFGDALFAAYSCEIPAAGRSSLSPSTEARLLWMQQDQYFLLTEYTEYSVVESVSEKLEGTAYLSDQSDSWVILRLSGPQSMTALERTCPIDLHPQAFPSNAVSRIIMEHMSAVIINEGEDSYLLMGLRSSAKSFLHAIETSIENIST